MSSSIRDAALACDRILQLYWATRPSDQWLEESIIDFKVWAWESGALITGRRGLDERLCTRKVYRSCLLRMLNTVSGDLQNAFDGATKTTLEHNHPAKVDPHLDRIKRTVKTMVREIVDLTKALVKSLPYTMLWEAEEAPLTKELEVELGSFKLHMHNLIRRTIAKHHWVQENPKTEIWNRIIEGNVRRRKRFLNARAKDSKRMTQNYKPPQTRRSKVRIPDPPKPILGSQTFQCPFCYEILPSYFIEPIPWKKHVLSDLEPYCCVAPTCSNPNRLYSSEASWRDHMESHISQERLDDQMALDEPHTQDEDSNKQGRDIECPLCEGPPPGADKLRHISSCLLDFAMQSMLHESENGLETDTKWTQANVQNQYRPNSFVYTVKSPAHTATESVSNESNDISIAVSPAFSDIIDDGLLAPSARGRYRERSSSQPQINSQTLLKAGQLSPLSTATQRHSTGSDISSSAPYVYHSRSHSNLRVQSHLYGGPLQNTCHFLGYNDQSGDKVVKTEIDAIFSGFLEAGNRTNTEDRYSSSEGFGRSGSGKNWQDLSMVSSNNVGLELIQSPS